LQGDEFWLGTSISHCNDQVRIPSLPQSYLHPQFANNPHVVRILCSTTELRVTCVGVQILLQSLRIYS